MDKKNKKVKVITLEEALKLKKGFYPLADLDYSIYPEIKKFVDDYNKAHPHLAIEVMNDTDKYIAKVKNAESELVRDMWNVLIYLKNTTRLAACTLALLPS